MTSIYPAIFFVIPAIHVFSTSRLPANLAINSLIALLLIGLILLKVFKIIVKDKEKASLVMTIFTFWFLYFQLSLDWLSSIVFKIGFARTSDSLCDSQGLAITLFISWSITFYLIGKKIWHSDFLINRIGKYIESVSIILLAILMINILLIGPPLISVTDQTNQYRISNGAHQLQEDQGILNIDAADNPDIYYIILDGLGSSDILSEVYDTNMESFIKGLKERGFYIPESSRSNYSQTVLSLASSLNLFYVDDLLSDKPISRNWLPLAELIQNSYVAKYLDYRGYETVIFSSGYWVTEGMSADKKYEPVINLNEYQEGLIANTPLISFYQGILYDVHRKRIQFTLEKLGKIPDGDKPIFVFSHIYAPHPPFVFNYLGEPIKPDRQFSKFDADGFIHKGGTEAEYILGYSGQAEYLLNQILEVVDQILNNSASKPIIIIQGDHGPGSMVNQQNIKETNLDERLSIFNAYFLPDENYEELYASITPVNSFRILFNQYFNSNFKLLDDKSYFSTVSKPYLFTEVTEELK